MDNSFELTINYKGKERMFSAEYMQAGYSYKINVDVDGQMISFEPDEERNFRAVMPFDEAMEAHTVDKMLVEQIALELIAAFKDS